MSPRTVKFTAKYLYNTVQERWLLEFVWRMLCSSFFTCVLIFVYSPFVTCKPFVGWVLCHFKKIVLYCHLHKAGKMAVAKEKSPKASMLNYIVKDVGGMLESVTELKLAVPVDGLVDGSLAWSTNNWQRVTNNSWVLNTVAGCKIEWVSTPVQTTEPYSPKISAKEQIKLTKEINC